MTKCASQQKDLAPARILERSHPAAAEKLRMRYKTYNDELELAKHYEAEGRVLILAPEDLYGLNTLKKNFEGLEMMYRKGYAAAEAIPGIPSGHSDSEVPRLEGLHYRWMGIRKRGDYFVSEAVSMALVTCS